jgi:DtxR family transcriptional regulator, manganese transport regulator
LKARLERSNNDGDHRKRHSDSESGKRLRLIRDAHNVNQKVVVQAQRQTDRMEDYLEVIYELIKNKGYATQTDISESLNVSLPGVTKMLQRLDERNYLKYEKYRGISLTEAGIKLAESIHEKHGLLSEFFKMIGVNGDIANIDAEGIEHHLHPQTLKKLREFMLVHKK